MSGWAASLDGPKGLGRIEIKENNFEFDLRFKIQIK
jgi:hypothetical protein